MKKAMLVVVLAVLGLAVSALILAGIFMNGEDQRSRQTSEQVAPTSEGTQEGGTIAEGAVNTDETGTAAASSVEPFRPVERGPKLVRQPNPGYPEIAQRAGLQGTVVVKVLVDSRGNPRRAIVIKSDCSVFNEAAKKAALQSHFRPAAMSSGPVNCWILIPYRFKLG